MNINVSTPTFAEARKAVVAFVVPFGGAVLAAMQASSPGGTAVTRQEWVGAVVLGLLANQAVFWTPNKGKAPEAPAGQTQTTP